MTSSLPYARMDPSSLFPAAPVATQFLFSGVVLRSGGR